MHPLITLLRCRAALVGAGLLLSLAAAAQGPALDPSFQIPSLYQTAAGTRLPGAVYDVVRQPDGKYVVGGLFNEVNGVAANNLVRLLPNGTPDPTFVTTGTDQVVTSLALQPDGKIVVGGAFSTLGGATRRAIGRLLPGGGLDVAFNPPTAVSSSMTAGNYVNSVSVQPDGRILIGGYFNVRGAGTDVQRLDRLDASTGQPDPAFQPYQPVNTITSNSGVSTHLLLPNGKIVVGGAVQAYVQGTLLKQFNADGTPDSGFPTLINYFISGINALAIDAAGKIYAAGSYNSAPGGGSYVRRLLPDGTADASFVYRGNSQITQVTALAVQPNGRVLVASSAVERLLADGSLDASFVPANGPVANSSSSTNRIWRLLVQPDGAIVAAGSFTQAGTTPVTGLVRMTDANVLRVRSAAADTRLAAWPVPAHDMLNLDLDAASRPQRVLLLDALGRIVRTQVQPAAQARLAVAGLPAGTYQLQVDFADGSRALRRVLLR